MEHFISEKDGPGETAGKVAHFSSRVRLQVSLAL